MRRICLILLAGILVLISGCGKVPSAAKEQAEIAINAAEDYLDGKITAADAQILVESASSKLDSIESSKSGSEVQQAEAGLVLATLKIAVSELNLHLSMFVIGGEFGADRNNEDAISRLKDVIERVKESL